MRFFREFPVYLYLLLLDMALVKAGDILYVAYVTPPSVRMFLKPFMDILISRGHTVTLLTNLDESLRMSRNISEISYVINQSVFQVVNKMSFEDYQNDPWKVFMEFEKFVTKRGADELLLNKKMKEMIRQGKKFDVVFTSGLFEEYSLPLAALLSKNIIFLHLMRVLPSFAYEMDVIQPYSYVPFTLSEYRSDMNIFERTGNALLSFFCAVFSRDLSKMDEHVAKEITEAPSISEVHPKVSLMFVNSDPVIYNSAPIMPHVVSIGGMNCKDAKPLPQDLESIMASSGENGVIYFSMGTFVDIRMASKELPEIFLNVFSRLNQTVLWKAPFQLEGVPSNVKLIKWVPQQDVLGHPKLLLYITQGGIFSLQEAIYHGVPVLGLPVFSDQFNNVVRMEELGLGLHLDCFNLTTEAVYSAITQIINDRRYLDRSKKYSAIFKDQPETPMERAVYWTEYLINHPGSSLHFRTSSSKLNLFQYHSLDVLLITIAILFLLLWIPVKLLNCYFKRK